MSMTQSVRMPTVLFERRPGRPIGDDEDATHSWESGSMRILPHLPLYQWSDYGKCWTRILMLEDGHYLRVCLTPSNPTVESEWEALREERIQWGSASLFSAAKNRITRELPAEVVRHMHHHLGLPVAERLLTGNIWAEIAPMWPAEYERPYDVTDWFSRCGYNGGIPLGKLQQNPPTWAEKAAADEAKRTAERNERIRVAVGDAEPLNETEMKLGEGLEHHDWSYSYSDCGETWRRGQAHREELERGLRALSVERRKIVWKAFVREYNEGYWSCPT